MSERYNPVPDYFELEPPMQPKRVVGDYVASQGILVPRRFGDFEEAQFAAESGSLVIARSEHPDEYSGPSGRGDSSYFEVGKDGVMKPRHYEREEDPARLYRHHIVTSGEEEPNSYASKVSESYWEGIPGVNVTCVADDAVEGRYHLFGFRYKNHDGSMPTMYAGAITEADGSIQRITETGKGADRLTTRFKEVIDFYNKVRGLDRFNPDHCPIMEVQLSDIDDQLYFLQYHRSRDAAPVPQQLDASNYDPREGWFKADAVRGAYLGGRALQLAMWYRGVRSGNVNAWGMQFPEDGSTSGDISFWTLDEVIARQRIAQLMSTSFNREYDKIAANHGPRSRMFKPQVSMLTNPPERYDYIPEELSKEALILGVRENKEVRIKTDVVSDGRDGFFRYGDELIVIDPFAE